jgi:spore coat polysaccharide biosynthesis protein SpsF
MTNKPKIIASVEARMSSSRLPGKMLMDISGKPVVLRVLERLSRAKLVDEIILATTDNPADDILADTVKTAGFSVFRGSENDVLKRVVDAHETLNTEVIVEICGDCPLIDPELVDLAVETFLANECDLIATGAHQSYPQGTEVQVFSFDDLAKISNTVNDPAAREHVSLYFYENPDIYRIFHIVAPLALRAPDIRLQLDYKEDLNIIREIYNELLPIYGDGFGIHEILEYINTHPEVAKINSHCKERSAR